MTIARVYAMSSILLEVTMTAYLHYMQPHLHYEDSRLGATWNTIMDESPSKNVFARRGVFACGEKGKLSHTCRGYVLHTAGTMDPT